MKITDKEFNLLSTLIKEKAGIYLKENKKALIVLRLSRRLESLDISNFEDYYNLLNQDKNGQELHYFIDNITTHYTFFLREKEQFAFFEEIVLPEVCTLINDSDLRVWSAASSTGEEAYTLAIILDEYFAKTRNYWNKELLGTDIARKVIDKASDGIYPSHELEKIPKFWKLKYFDKVDNNFFKIKESLKKEVTFRCFNLLEPFYPFKKKFHVIFCRNVLIYFDKSTKERVIRKLVDNLCEGGYLFLGLSESINYREMGLTYIRPSIFRKVKSR